MLTINMFNHLLKPLSILLFISLFSGCGNFSKNMRINNSYNFQGEVYSQGYIPENSKIILSISQLDSRDFNSNYNYQINTKEISRTILFKINIPDDVINNPKLFGISVRVEKENELIMMTNNLISLPRDLSEKLAVPVLPIK